MAEAAPRPSPRTPATSPGPASDTSAEALLRRLEWSVLKRLDGLLQGDFRTYGHPVVLRPVTSEDAMTADWARLPYDVLEKVSTRITNEVREINRVTVDITSKPPGTIEWE